MAKFDKRIAALENNRRIETVLTLQELILDMYNDGWMVIEIARALEKDHATILHHLWKLGVNTRIRKDEAKTRREVLMENTRKIQNEREKTLQEERKRIASLKLKKQLEEKTRVAKDRAKVLALYKQGLTYRAIAAKTGFPYSRIQDLLIFSEEYQKIKGGNRARKFGRAVYQLSMSGKKMKKWNTIREAANATGTWRNSITNACKGRIPSAGGFKWSYAK